MNIESKLLEAMKVLYDAGKIDFGEDDKFKMTVTNYPIESTKLMDTIFYLKENAKLNEICKIISESDVLTLDFSKKVDMLEKQILAKKDEIANLPKLTLQKPVTGLTGEFRVLAESIRKRRNESLRAKRKEKVQALNNELKELKEKLKAIKDFQRALKYPLKNMPGLFNTETKLNELKANSLNKYVFDNLYKGDIYNSFIENFGMFSKDESGNIVIDEKKAREFLILAKSKNSITRLYEYGKAKEEVSNLRVGYRQRNARAGELEEFATLTDTEEMKFINNSVNDLSRTFSELHQMEQKARRGNAFTRFTSFVKRAVGIDDSLKVPNRVLEKRDELATKINKFIDQLEENETLLDSYVRYVSARKEMDESSLLDLDGLAAAARNVMAFGDDMSFIKGEVDLDEMRVNAIQVASSLRGRAKKDYEILEEAKEKEIKLSKKLTERDQKIFEKIGKDGVDYFAKKFYKGSVSRNGSIIDERRSDMSKSTALMVLEGLVKKKRIDYSRIMDTYCCASKEANKEDELSAMKTRAMEAITAIKKKTDAICGIEEDKLVSVVVPSMAQKRTTNSTKESVSVSTEEI